MKDPCWIWIQGAIPERNALVRFRRAFKAKGDLRLTLSISADSRYWVWVNGAFLGFGPVRSWVNHWKFDTYELTGKLRDGENVIAVLVNHLGHGTFQYLPAAAGLAVEVCGEGGARLFRSDAQWRCAVSEAYRFHAPRISVQQGFEEQFDARREDGWHRTGYDDTAWKKARRVAPPHPSLEPRGIPLLAEETVYPRRLVRVERVRPASHAWTLDLRSFLLPEETSCKVHYVRGHLFTRIWSDRAQAVSFVRPHYHAGEFKVNGTVIPALDGAKAPAAQAQRARLKKGWNTVLIPYPALPDGRGGAPARSHFGHFVLVLRARHPLVWSATGSTPSGSPWGFVGPFGFAGGERKAIRSDRDGARLLTLAPCDAGATADRFAALYAEPPSAEILTASPWFREIPEQWIHRDDVFASAAGDEATGKHAVADGKALLSDDGKWTTITPGKAGKAGESIRLLLDFGREVVGCHTFEVEAQAGTVLDFHHFEFIQLDGRENWTEGMNNTFRYVCRQGRQSYRTLVRRGFQYTYLICRNLRRPLRIRTIAARFVAYPQARRGRFHCSDALLDRIWEAGAHTLRCCSEDTYTDCPSNEQVHWTGDARNEALIDWAVNGDPRLWHRSLLQTGQSLELPDYPITASQVPSAWPNIVPAWSFLWMRSCREYLLWTGDYAGARNLFPWIERNVAGIAAHRNGQGLFAMQAYNLFDWAAMDTPADGVVTHVNCFAVLALKDCAELARGLGKQAAAARFEKLAQGIAKSIDLHLWDDKRKAYLDSLHADGKPGAVFSQQTQTAALISGVAAGARAAHCLRKIDAPPADFVRSGSPFFGFFLLELLARRGKEDALLDAMRRDWGFMIGQGATTFWEMWSLRAGRLTRSHCHGWSAAPAFFLSSAVLGIEPASPGFATVRLTPRLGDLRFAEGTMPTPHGPIEVRFERKGKSLISHVTLPDGVVREKTERQNILLS